MNLAVLLTMDKSKLIILLAIAGSVLFLSGIFILVRNAVKAEQKIYEYGIETDSVVSRNEEKGVGSDKSQNCYVTYTGDDGLEHEGYLNVSINLPIGRKVRIKYLPPKYDYAVFISQEIEEQAVNNKDFDYNTTEGTDNYEKG